MCIFTSNLVLNFFPCFSNHHLVWYLIYRHSLINKRLHIRQLWENPIYLKLPYPLTTLDFYVLKTHFWILLLKSRNIAEPSITKDYSALDEGDTIKSIAVSPYFLYRLEARERGSNGGIFVAPQNYRLAFCTLVWAQSLCFACSISKFVRIKTIILLENVICQKLTFFLRFLTSIEERGLYITEKIGKK